MTGRGRAVTLLAAAALAAACRDRTGPPERPILDPGAPADAPARFAAAADAPGGPCLIEPQDGSLYPRDGLRPRVRFLPVAGQDLFEIRFQHRHWRHDLVVYTTRTAWTVDEAAWRALAAGAGDDPVTVTVRALDRAVPAAAAAAAPVRFRVAPVAPTGTISYFTMGAEGKPEIKALGDGGQAPARLLLEPARLGPSTRCVGCHVATPDGRHVAIGAGEDPGNGDPAHLAFVSPGDGREPAFLTASARTLLGRPHQHFPAFSAAHWTAGDRLMLSILDNRALVWTDLEASSPEAGVGWGEIAREGDPNPAGAATWSRDGRTVVYCSTTGGLDTGVNFGETGRLFQVPFNGRAGGPASPLGGAGGDGLNTYYPTFSPDDRLVAYTQSPVGSGPRRPGRNFHNPKSEVWVVTVPGGVAHRLAGNDPPACLGRPSPGVTNSWPRWAPEVHERGGRRYYWLVFSSTRLGKEAQLFLGAVVTEGDRVASFPAVYLWSQPGREVNVTASWDRLEAAGE